METIELNETNNNVPVNKPDTTTTNNFPHVDWTSDHEQILVEWADKAMCYRWLHAKAHQSFAKANAWFTIPVIIMSTTTGTANFAQDRLPEEYRGMFSMGVGAVNIFAGILTTIQQFLKIGELNEAHRVASIAWDKFYRNTKVELAKSPTERMPVVQMLKHAKEEFDRLMETSPTISEKIIEAFNTTFSDGMSKAKGALKGELTKRQQAYMDLIKPEICDTIESTAQIVYKHKDNVNDTKNNTFTAIALARKAVEVKKKQDKIENIMTNFQSTRQRLPTNQEIVDELDGQIAMEFVENFLKETAQAATPEDNTILQGDNMV